MSQIRQSDSVGNLSETPQMSNTPVPQQSGKKKSSRKRRRRSHISVPDDSIRSGSLSPNAFWQNYQKAFQWGNNQEVAYWRSRAVALELENKMLRQQIMRLSLSDKNITPMQLTMPVGVHDTLFDSDRGSSNNVNIHSKRKRKHKSKKSKPKAPEPVNDVSHSQLEFEITEEMKDFMELHMRHKMEQEKKQKEDKKKTEDDLTAAGEENAKLISHPINFNARADELKMLYGDASPTIHGMETAIQLSFHRHCEKSGARLWPNIPLRL